MKKILSTLVMCVILGVGSVWAEQVSVTLYAESGNTTHPLITETRGGENLNPASYEGTFLQLNKSDQEGTAWIQFASPEHTIISSYYFQTGKNGDSPTYTINDGAAQQAPDDKNYNTYVPDGAPEIPGINTDNTFKLATTEVKTSILFWTSYYYCRVKNFNLNIVIPEVIDRKTTNTTELAKLSNLALNGGTNSSSGYVAFVVKDPIDISNPQNYFSAIVKTYSGDDGWSVDTEGWQCIENNPTNRNDYKVDDQTEDSYILLVPITYTAGSQRGTFNAEIELSSLNTANTIRGIEEDTDIQKAQITVGDVLQEYAISWGNDWKDEVTLYKGDTYSRIGEGGYLSVSDDQLTLYTPSINNIKPADPDAKIVSFDPSSGMMTLHQEGKVELTYTQPASSTHKEKVLRLVVNIIKRTPKFTLQSDEYDAVNNVHIFYVNHEYTPFVTSSNSNLIDYPLTVENNIEGNDQFISFNGANAVTYSVPMEDITITVNQEEGDKWYSNSEQFTISVREDPIHVGTLCNRTMKELFEDNRFTIDKLHTARLNPTEDGIRIGLTAGGSNGGYVVFKFTGTPDKLTCTHVNTNGNGTWTYLQSVTGLDEDWMPMGEGNTFDVNARYLKIQLQGTQAQGDITELCITERVGFDVDPENISLLKLPSGDVASSIFIATISNLLEVQATIEGANADDFELQDVGTYDDGTNTWTINYRDGLGIDRTVKVPVKVGYKGNLNAADLLQKTCSVKLVGGDETKYVAVKIEELTNNEDGVPNIIIATTADETGMQTGTDITAFTGDFKTENIVKTKDVKLANTFDENGMALFDEIYVFGKTVLADGATKFTKATTTTTNNAVTPCYVYHKGGDGRRYSFYQKIDNVNQATKQLPNTTERCWTIAAGENKKLYFTGFCPFGSNGASKDDEGIIYIKGAAGAKVDVYLEDCQLYSRQHTPYGDAKSKESVDMPTFPISVSITGAIGGGAASSAQAAGSASAIVFECTNDFNRENPFRPTIHTIGNNVLYSQLGCTGLASFAGEEKRIGQYCASLQVRITEDSKDSYTVLSFDDKWPTDATDMAAYRRTNGYIRFQKSSGNSPSIELGNENTILNFNGGQIELQNSVPGAQYYLNTLAVCCRLGYAVWNNLTLFVGYGLGQDEVGGEVNFNDGTVNALPAKITNDAYKPYFDLDANGNTTTLRCPQKTYITGGSHNSDVRACAAVDMTGGSPKDKKGNTLVKLDYQLPGEAGISVDATTNLVKPNTMPVTLTCVGCGENGANTTLDLEHYGKESLCPDKDQYIHLWAPGAGRVEYDITSWVLSMTRVVGDYEGMHSVELGGPVTVPTSNTDKVNNLLYAQIDDNMFEVLDASDPVYKIPGKVNEYMYADVKDHGEKTYDNIENTDPYTIHEKIYYVRVVNADEWIMFAPPFDISNVYVLETSSETDLETLTREEALKQQAGYNLDFASIFAAEIMKDMESNLNRTFNSHYDAYRVYARDLSNKLGKNYSADVKKIQIQPFTGTNYDANFFLYKSNTREWAYTDGAFATDWEIVSPVTKKIGDVNRKVIMEKDNIYALQFPFCPRCEYDPETGEIGERDYWDYWTGKFIIFEGYGPQTIDGTNKSATIEGLDYTVNNSGQLRGNPVFAKYMVSSESALFFDSYYDEYVGGDEFGSEEDLMRTQKAGGVYMVANLPAPSLLPGRVKSVDPETGDVHFESSGANGDNTTTSTPTILGNNQMMVYNIEGGVGIVPVVAQQVSIYNAAGQLVISQYLTDEVHISLPTGIYLIAGAKDQFKAVVK